MKELEPFRSEISKIDSEIISLISQRMEVSKKIGKIKKKKDLSIVDNDRRQVVITHWLDKANENDLDRTFILKIFELLHSESVKIQENIR